MSGSIQVGEVVLEIEIRKKKITDLMELTALWRRIDNTEKCKV